MAALAILFFGFGAIITIFFFVFQLIFLVRKNPNLVSVFMITMLIGFLTCIASLVIPSIGIAIFFMIPLNQILFVLVIYKTLVCELLTKENPSYFGNRIFAVFFLVVASTYFFFSYYFGFGIGKNFIDIYL